MASDRIDRPADDDEAAMRALGIAFDGRAYWYGRYRYEALRDAIDYATPDRSRPSHRDEMPLSHPREEPARPTGNQRQAMAELGVTFDGRHYRYDVYRYDRCADVTSYARLKSG